MCHKAIAVRRSDLRFRSAVGGAAWLGCLFALAASPWAALAGDWKEEIGFTQLRQRLGPSLPSGGSIHAAQIEMPVDGEGCYLPDPHDSQLAGKLISGLSGSGGISHHATIVGQYYCGLTSSIGPGIRLVATYEANDWAGRGCLNLNSAFEPQSQTRVVQNHSWVGTFGRSHLDVDALRRVDYLVERDGVLIAAGVKNGAATPMPELVCSAYNVISVGLTNGRSSRGPARIDTVGRVKPEIVAPLTATSWATPVVASAASLLIESIESSGLARMSAARNRSARQLLAKALLLGGATKDEWPDWRRGFAAPCTDGTVPLDYRYGAGELNLENSYRILEAGWWRGSSSRDVPATGWDLGSVTARGSVRYFFNVPSASVCRSLSVLATWNRRIHAGRGEPLVLTPSLANIDLRLYRAAGYVPGVQIDASVSRIDNVEHIFLRNLPSGRYMIEVASDLAWDYCLTWDAQMEPAPAIIADGGQPRLAGNIAASSKLPVPARPPALTELPKAPASDDDLLVRKSLTEAQPLP